MYIDAVIFFLFKTKSDVTNNNNNKKVQKTNSDTTKAFVKTHKYFIFNFLLILKILVEIVNKYFFTENNIKIHLIIGNT